MPALQFIIMASPEQPKFTRKVPPQELEQRQEIEVQREIGKPWEAMEREDEGWLLAQYGERVALNEKSARFIDGFLTQEARDAEMRFAKDWFEEHREQLRGQGVSPEVSDSKKIAIAIEQGALDELRRKEEYRERREEIENLYYLRKVLREEHLPAEVPFLLLNKLQRIAENIENEIKKMRKAGKSEGEIRVKEGELERLFEIRKEVAEIASGRKLEDEARGEVDVRLEPKDTYMGKNLEREKEALRNELWVDVFSEEWERLSEKQREQYESKDEFIQKRLEAQVREMWGITIDRETALALLAAGDKPEEFKKRGIIRKKIEVRGGTKLSRREFKSFLEKRREDFQKTIEENAQRGLEKRWEEKRKELIKKGVEERIKNLAKSPEQAVEGIEGVYRRAKDRLISEWTEKELKKEPKTSSQLQKIEKEFSQRGVNPREFIQDVLSRKGELRELTGDIEEDEEKIESFLESYGIPTRGLVKKRMDPERYKREVRKERGFLELLFEFIFAVFSEHETAKTERR